MQAIGPWDVIQTWKFFLPTNHLRDQPSQAVVWDNHFGFVAALTSLHNPPWEVEFHACVVPKLALSIVWTFVALLPCPEIIYWVEILSQTFSHQKIPWHLLYPSLLEEIWGLKWALEENAPTISSCELEFKNQ